MKVKHLQIVWRLKKLFASSHEISPVRKAFDLDFYLSNYPDIADANSVDPVEHYCLYGWKEGRDPAPDFSTSYYLDANPDVRDAGINPFFHYLSSGRDEGRQAVAPGTPEANDTAVCHEISLVRKAFDLDFYLSNYPDIADANSIDPVEHYCLYGWKEHRDPTPDFSTSYYLDANPDVRDAGINPFFHYLSSGRDEGRRTNHPGGHVAAALTNMVSLEEMVASWPSKPVPEKLLSACDLLSELSMASKNGAKGLMISVSHDNYVEVPGGVQYCIQREQVTAKESGFAYLHLSPYQPRLILTAADRDSDMLVTVLLDGLTTGVARMSSVIECVQRISDDFSKVEVVVHHLMGHSPEQISELVWATGDGRCWMWAHDFFTLCPSYALQRNNVAFCGAPEISSNACHLCLYGKERRQHNDRILAFFDELAVHMVAPSKFAANFWSKKTDCTYASLNTCDHMKVEYRKHRREKPASDGPITIAYVGFPGAHKGWPVFEDIVRKLSGKRPDIRFVYFGMSEVRVKGLETVSTKVTTENPNAMIDALADEQVDFVLHWATCAETFSFSTHEAFAAGAYVLTNPGSGNVAAVVKRRGGGVVFDDESDLKAFFKDGRIEALAEEVRAKRSSRTARVTYSAMTFSVMDKGS